MSGKSNNQGRALEYRICSEITSIFKKSRATEEASADNKRDKAYFEELPKKLQDDFSKCAKVVVVWLVSKVPLNQEIVIDRFSDAHGVAGDPTDILISFDGSSGIRLSIKNKYPALKHQRLPRLPIQCGIKNKAEIEAYLAKHEAIWENFRKKSNVLVPKAKYFKQLVAKDANFVGKNLYLPLTSLVMDFLNSHPSSAPMFFKFLSGSHSFYMVKNGPKKVSIFNFASVLPPKTMKCIRDRGRGSTLFVEFSNGWTLSLRLHSASSRLYTPAGAYQKSVKMDTTFPDMEKYVPVEHFEK